MKLSDVYSTSICNKLMNVSVTDACKTVLSFNYNYDIDLFAVLGINEQSQGS